MYNYVYVPQYVSEWAQPIRLHKYRLICVIIRYFISPCSKNGPGILSTLSARFGRVTKNTKLSALYFVTALFKDNILSDVKEKRIIFIIDLLIKPAHALVAGRSSLRVALCVNSIQAYCSRVSVFLWRKERWRDKVSCIIIEIYISLSFKYFLLSYVDTAELINLFKVSNPNVSDKLIV